MMLDRVDLPAPFSPSKAMTSPGATLKSLRRARLYRCSLLRSPYEPASVQFFSHGRCSVGMSRVTDVLEKPSAFSPW